MHILCPACKKENEGVEQCTRCGCQLSELITVIEGAAEHLRLGYSCLASQDWQEALHHADRSWELAHTQESAKLASLAAIGIQDIKQVVVWRRRAAKQS